MATEFEWHAVKAVSNLKKHGVTFELAREVFYDPFALIEQHRVENGEARWRAIGMTGGLAILVVAHTVSDTDGDREVIRIISARHATRQERYRYGRHRSH
jgi:uncharacterized protein